MSNNQEEIEPAVDFPVQFNFGSPYSSSLTVFFDFNESQEIIISSNTENKFKSIFFKGKK